MDVDKKQLKHQTLWLLQKAFQLQGTQSKEDFDPFSLSGEEIDAILAERELWIQVKARLDEEGKKDSPTCAFLDERIGTINGILKRLAN